MDPLQLVEQICSQITADQRLNSVSNSEKLQTHPPAAENSIQALLQFCRHPLPPSYVEVLRKYDGIQNFYGIFCGDFLPSSYRSEYNNQWRDCLDLSKYFLFIADDDGSAVFFDLTTRQPSGEMEVVEIINYREKLRYANLTQFLKTYLERISSQAEYK